MRRVLITWSAVFALLFAGFAASVSALNADLYSAHGFVTGYLGALARHDTAAALALPGVDAPAGAERSLLTPAAMGDIDDVRVVRDQELPDGTHDVIVEYSISTPPATGRSQGERAKARSEFVVEREGTRLGLFPTWRFAASPLSTLAVTVLHDQRFEVNGFEATTAAANVPSDFLVFAPGLYVLGHDSAYLTAKPVPTAVARIAATTDAIVDVQANEEFVAEVQENVSAHLAQCVTQEVLMPTGCPFGQQLKNRVTTPPKWSMVSDPTVSVVPGTEPGTWMVPPANAVAHLTVDVRSLFDGTVSTFDEDVVFSVQYALTFEANDRLLLTAVYE